MLIRIIQACLAIVLSAAALADDTGRRVDDGLLASLEPIAEGAASPRPAEGDTTLLQFWASWCHSCGTLMWDMDEIVSRNTGIRYLAVSIDDESADAREYIRKHGLYEKYAGHYFVDADKRLAESLGVSTVPTIFLVGRDGDVLLRKSGHLNSADFRDLVSAARSSP